MRQAFTQNINVKPDAQWKQLVLLQQGVVNTIKMMLRMSINVK